VKECTNLGKSVRVDTGNVMRSHSAIVMDSMLLVNFCINSKEKT